MIIRVYASQNDTESPHKLTVYGELPIKSKCCSFGKINLPSFCDVLDSEIYVRKTRREFENCTKTNVCHDHKYNENPKRLTIIFSTAITLELVLEVNHRL
jgi:hypothetical protein